MKLHYAIGNGIDTFIRIHKNKLNTTTGPILNFKDPIKAKEVLNTECCDIKIDNLIVVAYVIHESNQ